MQKFARALFVVGALLGLSAATAPPVAAAENVKKAPIVTASIIVSSPHVVALDHLEVRRGERDGTACCGR